MEIDLDVQGVDGLIAQLNGISTTVNRNVNRILRESSEPLMDEIRKNTPVFNVDKYFPKTPKRTHQGHAKDHVVRSNVKRKGDTKVVEVGYGAGWGWYMWFLEKGTYSLGNPKGIAPRHHVERALNASKSDVAEVQIDGLRRLFARYVE